ncbi:MAG: dCTP deaminase [Candidatus Mcinerneyibacterium aminivorans]|uniref:dCTP deaminase n=1 Tax=Candidatus Mcinerneyibacterium aminivorans TaxID=2703815 RepID=A0A5D0ME04_9BACT|nr:MAG: dCTP deaminase [Candidatus Mcinerneyibacterium aminivorans]
MKYLSGKKISEMLDNIIYEKKQACGDSFYLTVNKIYKFSSTGELDFGGSEFKKCDLKEIKPEKRNSEDDYGWWELKQGHYFIEFNETLKMDKISDERIYISPLGRLMLAGGDHTKTLHEKRKPVIDTILRVAESGLNIKENARISKLEVLKN